MVSIDYCILSMEIMEIYHKCSSDNDSQIYMANALRFFLTIGLWEEYNNNKKRSRSSARRLLSNTSLNHTFIVFITYLF